MVVETTIAELVIPDPSETPANHPALSVESAPSGAGWSVRARNLGPGFVAALGGSLDSVLRVKVVEAQNRNDEDLPDIAGDREILPDGVRFIPHFPFDSGVPFRAILDLRAPGRPGPPGIQTLEFSFRREATAAETAVTHVFPSIDVLPENLLRLYVCFSNPMQRYRAADNIEVLGPDGRPAPDVLYRAPVELWDRSMTCLTVLLDPGRLKRGVGPNRMLGPPLKAGQRYTLAISPGMIDVYGRPLREGFIKSFSVSEAVREPVAIEQWTIRPPEMGGRQALELVFPRPLDWAQLWRGFTIASESGQPVSGRIDIDLEEKRWRFTPDAPWQEGAHSILISADLEDVSGNTPYGAFDGPVRSADDVAREVASRSIPFEARQRQRVRAC
jgi:hypothetical protein